MIAQTMSYDASLDLGSAAAVADLFSYPNIPDSPDTVFQFASSGSLSAC